MEYEEYDDMSSGDSCEDTDTEESEVEEELDEDFLEENSDNEMNLHELEEKKISIKKYYGYPFLNSFEKARVLGKRTEQIIAGSKIFVEPKNNNPYEIALQELEEKKIPLIIRRYFGNKFKDISVNDLILLE